LTLLRLFGIALLAAVMLLLLREGGGKLAPLVALSGGVALLGFAISRTGELLSFLSELELGEGASAALSFSLRAVGLAALTEVTAGTCRDLGEGGLATKVEWCGRAEILAVSLPMLSELFELAGSFLAS